MAGNAGNHGNNIKFHRSDQTLNQTKGDINKLRLGKISLQETVRMKISIDSGFSNVFYGIYLFILFIFNLFNVDKLTYVFDFWR